MLKDEFNCLGRYSDAAPDQCGELRFISAGVPALDGAFKTPSLRGAALRPPYMHAGQLATLTDVVRHYQAAAPSKIGKSELRPIVLNEQELQDLAAFLSALNPL